MESFPPNKKKIIIAVDGFSSCGKSTFAREVAARIGYIFIDTGAMYRAVTLLGLRGASDIYLDGENVESRIRGIEVSNSVSRVSSIGAVREKLVHLQQQMGKQKGVVMDGRDIGTVVFPNAELKIFMTADPAIRAQRRYAELTGKGEQVTLEEVMQNLLERDHADQTRAISPLRKADDAIVLDNSFMTIGEELEWALELIGKLTA